MSHERLTCLVPTHNRPHFLRRLLKFYGQFRPGWSFLVADSSDSFAAAENVGVIELAKRDLDIEYHHFKSDLYGFGKCAHALKLVRSPFVVLCADDDFLFPEAVSRCVELLANEPGYASAMGRAAELRTMLPRWRGRLKVHKGYSIEHDRPFDRCRQMAAQWSFNFYAVNRTESLLNNFQIAMENTNSQSLPHLPEILLSQLSVLRGRVKVLPMMYTICQKHGANTSLVATQRLQPQAELLYQQLKRCLADQFHQAGIDRADCEQFVDDRFGGFRYPDFNRSRRRGSAIEQVRRAISGLAERAVDFFWTDRVRHCRSIRASDFAGCEPTWRVAVQLMCDFPHGIPSEHSTLDRCA